MVINGFTYQQFHLVNFSQSHQLPFTRKGTLGFKASGEVNQLGRSTEEKNLPKSRPQAESLLLLVLA